MERITDRDRRLADYIYNDLGQEDIVAIENEISNDPELSESYQLNMQVKEYLQAKLQLEEMRSDPQLEDAEKLADMALDFESRNKEEDVPASRGGKRNRIRIRKLTIAAAVAATVAIVVSFGIVPFSISQDKLFDRYYEPFEASDYSQRGGSNEMYRDIATGIDDYMGGRYSQSIDRFNDITSTPAIQPEVQLFSALSYMGLGHYQEAQNILESVVNSNNRYQPESMWYLGLCYLKTGQFEKARTLFAQLENYDGLYQRDARSLRKKLRRFNQ
jgi:tetratricopeptide (TPR) repeat protein